MDEKEINELIKEIENLKIERKNLSQKILKEQNGEATINQTEQLKELRKKIKDKEEALSKEMENKNAEEIKTKKNDNIELESIKKERNSLVDEIIQNQNGIPTAEQNKRLFELNEKIKKNENQEVEKEENKKDNEEQNKENIDIKEEKEDIDDLKEQLSKLRAQRESQIKNGKVFTQSEREKISNQIRNLANKIEKIEKEQQKSREDLIAERDAIVKEVMDNQNGKPSPAQFDRLAEIEGWLNGEIPQKKEPENNEKKVKYELSNPSKNEITNTTQKMEQRKEVEYELGFPIKNEIVPTKNPQKSVDKLIVHPDIAIAKSGLEIFREQYNKMPEMKRKHALSQSPAKYLFTIAGVAGAAGLVPMLAAGAVPIALVGGAATALYGPVVKRLSGQSKLEKQIMEQFKEMDQDEFIKMARYLSEEKLITLKPHCAIMNALNRVSKEVCLGKAKELREELADLQAEVAKFDEKEKNGQELTPSENKRANEIRIRMDELKGTGDRKGEIEEIITLPKEIKRGGERTSNQFKGNFKGSKLMNLFNRRNHTTEEYSKFINEYADAGRAHDEELAFSEYERSIGNENEANKRANTARKFSDLQSEVLNKNTVVRFGRSCGPANAGLDGTSARVVSDQRDNTVRAITVGGTLCVGLANTFVTMVDQVENLNLNADEAQLIANAYNNREHDLAKIITDIKSEGNVSPEDIKNAIMSEMGSQINADELTNMRTYNTISYQNSDYVAADELYNMNLDNNLSSLNAKDFENMSTEEMLKNLQDAMIETGVHQKASGQILDNNSMMSGIDHSGNKIVNEISDIGKESEAKIIAKFSNLVNKINQIPELKGNISANVVRMKNNFFGPAMTAVSAAMAHAKDIKDSMKQSRDKNLSDNRVEGR